MRLGTVTLTICLALAAPATQAQPTAAETARQAAPATTGQGSVLQGYVLMLQATEQDLKAAREKAAQEPASYSGSAMTPARQQLMREVRDAYHAMQNAPEAVQDTEAYRDARVEVQQAFTAIGPGWDQSTQQGVAAADRALAALDRLRQSVAGMAEAAGGAVPAPPVAGGGR